MLFATVHFCVHIFWKGHMHFTVIVPWTKGVWVFLVVSATRQLWQQNCHCNMPTANHVSAQFGLLSILAVTRKGLAGFTVSQFAVNFKRMAFTVNVQTSRPRFCAVQITLWYTFKKNHAGRFMPVVPRYALVTCWCMKLPGGCTFIYILTLKSEWYLSELSEQPVLIVGHHFSASISKCNYKRYNVVYWYRTLQ